MTKAELIRTMDDATLAVTISEWVDCEQCESTFGKRPCDTECCPDFWESELKKEASA